MHMEFYGSLTYAWSYAPDRVSDGLTVVCGQLACLSQNRKSGVERQDLFALLCACCLPVLVCTGFMSTLGSKRVC